MTRGDQMDIEVLDSEEEKLQDEEEQIVPCEQGDPVTRQLASFDNQAC